jgi:hypothetical protein
MGAKGATEGAAGTTGAGGFGEHEKQAEDKSAPIRIRGGFTVGGMRPEYMDGQMGRLLVARTDGLTLVESL